MLLFLYFSPPSVFYVLSGSTYGLFNFGVSLLSITIGTWCGNHIVRKISKSDNIILSFIFSMSLSLLWPFTLPVTFVAFMLFCCSNGSVTYQWCISKFKLDSSKLVPLESTSREIERLKSSMKDASCAVCLGNIKLQKKKKNKQHPYSIDTCATKCWHIFHYNCITEWFLKCKTCPMCRQNSLIEQLRIYYWVYKEG